VLRAEAVEEQSVNLSQLFVYHYAAYCNFDAPKVHSAKFRLAGQMFSGCARTKVAKKATRTYKTQTRRNRKSSISQLLNFAPDSYLERTSRPIYAIVFLLPFIVFYEIAVIFSSADLLERAPYLGPSVLVETFVWVQTGLTSLGFGGKFVWVAPPLAVVVILTALQLVSRKRWYFGINDIWPMAIECILLAAPLIVLSLFLSSPVRPQGDIVRQNYSSTRIQSQAIPNCSFVAVVGLSSTAADTAGSTTKGKSLLADIITGIGAGIYEELIFRLILICVLMLLFQDILRLSHNNSIILSIFVSAALFSAHHHIVFVNGQLSASAPFNWTEFGFRTVAGVYFAVLFAIRGFAITAGTHAFYDIIATVINTVFFPQ
jgi:hypothetical protein